MSNYTESRAGHIVPGYQEAQQHIAKLRLDYLAQPSLNKRQQLS